MARLDDLRRQLAALARERPKEPLVQRIFDKREDIRKRKTGDAEKCVACMRRG